LIDATLEQEAKIAALEKVIAKLSNAPASDASESSDTKRDLGALKEWLKE
jgi:serine O-acetyltransferase